MTPYPPRYCRPEAYARLAAQLDVIDSTTGLIRAAVAIASHELPHADAGAVDTELDRIAQRVRERVRRPDLDALLAHAHQVLFEEEGFAGNTENYYDRLNSYLPNVLETRRGLPIMLTLVYKGVLERLGVSVVGINAPGHFLAGVMLIPPGEAPSDFTPTSWGGPKAETPPPPFGFAAGDSAMHPEPEREPEIMLVDPFFGGRVLSPREAIEQIASFTGVPESQRILARATHRQWLARVTHNLELIFARDDRYADVSAMIEMRRLLDVAEA